MTPLRVLTISAIAIAIAMGAAYGAGLRWNLSPSMPRGIWLVKPAHAPIQRGDVVTLCLDPEAATLGRERGYLTGGECPGDVELLVKAVVAVPGDTVEITDDGMAVNGSLIPHSRPLPTDDAGRAMLAVQDGTYHVADGQVWIIGTGDPRSYDSRYTGPLPIANLRGTARPFFVQH